MGGRTGKMTAEALAARGPRFVLAYDQDSDDLSKTVIYREDQRPAGRFSVIAKSFSMGYLRKIQSANSF